MMNEQDVIGLLNMLEYIGIGVWLDGGWGVDALLGSQSRPHNDIDIFIEKKDCPAFIAMVQSKGYQEVEKDFTTEDHTAWRDSDGREIDLHLFERIDADTLRFENELYPSAVLSGHGKIGNIAVQCLTAGAQLLYHQGYEHTEKDVQDVLLLCKTFGFEIPEEYKQ